MNTANWRPVPAIALNVFDLVRVGGVTHVVVDGARQEVLGINVITVFSVKDTETGSVMHIRSNINHTMLRMEP